MLALSIRQPWAWFILYGGKCFENRKWDERYLQAQLARVPIGSHFRLHAAQGMTEREFDDAIDFAKSIGCTKWPSKDSPNLHRGGYVGLVRLVRVVRDVREIISRPERTWFTGPIALELSDPYPTPFQPAPGALGFF